MKKLEEESNYKITEKSILKLTGYEQNSFDIIWKMRSIKYNNWQEHKFYALLEKKIVAPNLWQDIPKILEILSEYYVVQIDSPNEKVRKALIKKRKKEALQIEEDKEEYEKRMRTYKRKQKNKDKQKAVC